MIWQKIKHSFNKKNCIKNSTWVGGELSCPVCHRPIATRYIFNGEVEVYVFGNYKKYKKQIENREDTQDITKERDSIPEIDILGWPSFCDNVLAGQDDILSLSENGGRVSKNCEVEEPSGARRDSVPERET